jgi:hypothetical protein
LYEFGGGGGWEWDINHEDVLCIWMGLREMGWFFSNNAYQILVDEPKFMSDITFSSSKQKNIG